MIGKASAQCTDHSKLLVLIKRQDILQELQTPCQHMVRKTEYLAEAQC